MFTRLDYSVCIVGIRADIITAKPLLLTMELAIQSINYNNIIQHDGHTMAYLFILIGFNRRTSRVGK